MSTGEPGQFGNLIATSRDGVNYIKTYWSYYNAYQQNGTPYTDPDYWSWGFTIGGTWFDEASKTFYAEMAFDKNIYTPGGGYALARTYKYLASPDGFNWQIRDYKPPERELTNKITWKGLEFSLPEGDDWYAINDITDALYEEAYRLDPNSTFYVEDSWYVKITWNDPAYGPVSDYFNTGVSAYSFGATDDFVYVVGTKEAEWPWHYYGSDGDPNFATSGGAISKTYDGFEWEYNFVPGDSAPPIENLSVLDFDAMQNS